MQLNYQHEILSTNFAEHTMAQNLKLGLNQRRMRRAKEIRKRSSCKTKLPLDEIRSSLQHENESVTNAISTMQLQSKLEKKHEH